NTTIYVGPETVQTPTGPVPTRHLRLITALSGQSSGGAVRDLWLNPDGLAVKEERQVSLRVRSPLVGVLTYQEQASFLLSGRPYPPTWGEGGGGVSATTSGAAASLGACLAARADRAASSPTSRPSCSDSSQRTSSRSQ